MPVNTLEVIKVQDQQIRPPGPKFVVCVEPRIGLFVRINSEDWRLGSVPIHRLPDHPFLQYDSFIECGEFLELDDYMTGHATIRGRINEETAIKVCQAIEVMATLNRSDRAAAVKAIETALHK